jgi:hypothetical protein
MYRTALTGALPPHASRFLPLLWPESRLKGATPTRVHRRLWVISPSSGSSARRVQDSPDSRDAPKESLVGFEGGVLLDGTVKVPIDALDLLLKPLDVRPDTLGERLRSHLQTIVSFAGDEHLDELTPPGEDTLQSDGFLLGDDAGSWFDRPGDSGEDEGIYLVGLGELANRFGEASSLARVNDGHADRAGGEALVSACGLHETANSTLAPSSRESISWTPSWSLLTTKDSPPSWRSSSRRIHTSRDLLETSMPT